MNNNIPSGFNIQGNNFDQNHANLGLNLEHEDSEQASFPLPNPDIFESSTNRDLFDSTFKVATNDPEGLLSEGASTNPMHATLQTTDALGTTTLLPPHPANAQGINKRQASSTDLQASEPATKNPRNEKTEGTNEHGISDDKRAELMNFLGVRSKDPKEAFRCFRIAADLGHPSAMYSLWICYLTGDGIDQDVTMGLKWLRRAIWAGYKDRVIPDPYYKLTSKWVKAKEEGEQYKFLEDLLDMLHRDSSIIDAWKSDQEFHDRTREYWLDYLEIHSIGSITEEIIEVLCEIMLTHITKVRTEEPLSQEREDDLSCELAFLAKASARYIDPQLKERIVLVCAAPHVEAKDYFSATQLLKQTTLGKAKIAHLLLVCESWRFPLIETWQDSYALMAELLLASESVDKDDLALFNNILTSLERNQQTITSNVSIDPENLKQRCHAYLQGKNLKLEEFLSLLNCDHIEAYFQYYSMKTLLNEAEQKRPDALFLKQLSEVLEYEMGPSKDVRPILLNTDAVEALEHIVQCCTQMIASDNPEQIFESFRTHLSNSLTKLWMRRMPLVEAFLIPFLAHPAGIERCIGQVTP